MGNQELTGAGASARREHERRKAKDEARIREKWGRLGGLAVALSDERQSTAAWAAGALGEEKLGAALDGAASSTLRLLHDRVLPGSRANFDHLAVTTAGVWVIDAKRYKGKRPELRVDGGIIRPRVERLLVGGREQTKLVDGVEKQIEKLRTELPGVPVRGALCFIDADWPLFGGDFRVRGVDVVWPKKLIATLKSAPAGGVDVDATVQRLSGRFRPA